VSSSFVEVCLIAIPKAHKVQKGQDGAGSTKASVARYLEEYDEQLSKNEHCVCRFDNIVIMIMGLLKIWHCL